jgi:gliding motility-associated-like protein
VTAATTTYEVTASISSCTATDHVTVTTFPYPVAIAGPDTTICYQTSAFLHGESNGSSFVWAPFNSLHEANTLHPSTVPVSSTSYVLYAFDTLGCSKPGTDTVMVTVQPDIIAFAGRDTTVVINQPLQMEATGGVNYKWSPSNGLSDINIPNPVAIFNSSPAEGYFLYKVLVSNETGCEDSALIQVKIFSTLPEIYAPSAFTPNGDGRNDYFRLVAAGIKNIQTFHVYNRWGELVYNSPRTHSSGWDGTYNGKQLASDTFVWMAKAVDYTGRIIFRKGTVILIR